jgi:hypothetical protein
MIAWLADENQSLEAQKYRRGLVFSTLWNPELQQMWRTQSLHSKICTYISQRLNQKALRQSLASHPGSITFNLCRINKIYSLIQ